MRASKTKLSFLLFRATLLQKLFSRRSKKSHKPQYGLKLFHGRSFHHYLLTVYDIDALLGGLALQAPTVYRIVMVVCLWFILL